MPSSVRQWWRRLSGRRKPQTIVAVAAVALCVLAALRYVIDSDGMSIVNEGEPRLSYLAVFLLVAADGVVPIFPGETTLNAASTAAAQGVLELLPIIVMGAFGAIAGDSALFWLARRYTRKVEPQLRRAKESKKVAQALAIMDSSAPALIVGGRYVPGLRFVVNATMGLSEMPYRRFVSWSILSGVLWSTYTCVLAYKIGTALGDFPLASVIISGLVTTVAIGIVLISLRRRRRRAGDADGERGRW